MAVYSFWTEIFWRKFWS